HPRHDKHPVSYCIDGYGNPPRAGRPRNLKFDALRPSLHEPEVRVVKISFAPNPPRHVWRWRPFAACIPFNRQSRHALHPIRLDAHRDFGQAWDYFGGLDDDMHRVSSRLAFEENIGTADVRLRRKRKQET